MTTRNKRLVGTSTVGDSVLNHQKLATEEGHGNVSKAWFDRTKRIEDVIDLTEADQQHVHNINRPLFSLRPIVREGRFCLLDKPTDRVLYPNKHAIRQLGTMIGAGMTYPAYLLTTNRRGNAELLANIIQHQIQAFSTNRVCLLRVCHDDQLHGIMPDNARYIRNSWYLRVLQRAIPDARVSHWRGDLETLYGNILIPDTIREESDSAYGALVSISNCEVRSRPFGQRPSLFRAICGNGCVWGETEGLAITLSNFGRGELDLKAVEKTLIANIHEQIPLATQRIDQLLATRSLTTNVTMKPVIAQFCRDHRLTKSHGSAVLNAWHTESNQTPELGSTLFGLINAVTRAGQTLDNANWVRFDEIGGRLATIQAGQWDSLVTRASKLTQEKVNRAFARWSMETASSVAG